MFLGYSITDENIKAILADVCECVPKELLGRLRDEEALQPAPDTGAEG